MYIQVYIFKNVIFITTPFITMCRHHPCLVSCDLFVAGENIHLKEHILMHPTHLHGCWASS